MSLFDSPIGRIGLGEIGYPIPDEESSMRTKAKLLMKNAYAWIRLVT